MLRLNRTAPTAPLNLIISAAWAAAVVAEPDVASGGQALDELLLRVEGVDRGLGGPGPLPEVGVVVVRDLPASLCGAAVAIDVHGLAEVHQHEDRKQS